MAKKKKKLGYKGCTHFGEGPTEICGACGPYHDFRYRTPINYEEEFHRLLDTVTTPPTKVGGFYES
jgi:hypothetical protein